MLVVSCGGAEPNTTTSTTAGDEVEPEAPPPARARAVARYGCEADGQWSLSFAIDDYEHTCDDDPEASELVVIQRPAGEDGQRFSFRIGSDAGEGPVCRAPAPCDEADHTFTITDGDPPRVEWSLSLADEGVEHGSAAVLLCNDAPPPPCVL